MYMLTLRPQKPYKLLKCFINFVTTVPSLTHHLKEAEMKIRDVCPFLKEITEIFYKEIKSLYMVFGDAVSTLDTFLNVTLVPTA